MLGAAAAFYWASKHDLDVLLITDGKSAFGKRTFERKLGSPPLEFAVADGDKPVGRLFGKPCWVVNGSSKPLRIVRIEYPNHGRGKYVETDSVTVLPGQRASRCSFDYRGPEFAPPTTLDSAAYAKWTFASWLTWDEDAP